MSQGKRLKRHGVPNVLRNSRREPMSIHAELMETSRGDEPASRRQVELHRTSEAPGAPTCRALAFRQEGGGSPQAASRKLNAGSSARLLDRNPRITQAFRAHQREQNCGIRRMQPDTAARGRAAKSRDMRRPVNGEIAVVEDRVRHRSIVVECRPMVSRERLRAEAPARRAVYAGGYRPSMAVLPVDDHGHALARLVDPDQDISASVARRRQHRYRYRGGGGCSNHCKSSGVGPRINTRRICNRMHYHLPVNALLPPTLGM